jgi:hypothetical protein
MQVQKDIVNRYPSISGYKLNITLMMVLFASTRKCYWYADQLTLLMSELFKQNDEHHSLLRSRSHSDSDIPTVLSDITA